MKQNLFLVALSGLALASCSQVDDVLEVHQNNAIGFESVVGKNTRAVSGDLNKDNFDQFMVHGYYTEEDVTTPNEIFKDQVVNKGADGNWTYTPQRFWIPDATYYFYAYSCSDDPLKEDYGKLVMDTQTQDNDADRALEIQNYVCNNEHQHDLVVAKDEGKKGMEKTATASIKRKVALKFDHALSKINVEFTSNIPGDYDVVISDVKIVNYYDKATFDYAPMAWRDFIKTGSTTIDLASNKGDATIVPGDAEKSSVTTNPVFMLPMNYTSDDPNNPSATVDLFFTVTLKKNNGQVYSTRVLKGTWQPVWEQGTAYTYHIELDGDVLQFEPIVFETTQDLSDSSWGTTQNVTMVFSFQ